MLWTVAVLFDSARTFYELLVSSLSDSEREALWQDYVRFGELFGMKRTAAPATYPAFQKYFDARIASDDMVLSPAARAMGYHISFSIPMPFYLRPARPIIGLLVKGSFPPRVRELYSLDYSLVDAAQFEAVTTAIKASRLQGPTSLVTLIGRAYGIPWRGDNAAFFSLVAKVDRRRVKRGIVTMPGFSDQFAG